MSYTITITERGYEVDGVEYSNLVYNNFSQYEDAEVISAYNETDKFDLNEAELFELNTRYKYLVPVIASLDHELVGVPASVVNGSTVSVSDSVIAAKRKV